MKTEPITIATPSLPDFDGFIDEDILKRFENIAVFYGDIINAQLIKTNRLLLEEIKKLIAK